MSRQPSAQAGPSNGKGRQGKTIQRTGDLLEKGGKGKGKEKQVFGGLNKLIGETKNLPSAISVEKFAKIRAVEILALQNAIKSAASQGSTRVFQTLPRHLRRRAASHNPRRVPKRLRARAAGEIDPYDIIAKIHRKRAKIRSKGNLRGQSRTTQLLLRQRDKKWLPTHMYHAKRFHMTNLWGFRLPLTPTLKSFRPAYRASKRGVMVFDTSYFGVIELEGVREDVVAVLSRMAGGAFAGPRYETGSRMAETTLHRPDTFPQGLIGPVEILWDPSTETAAKVWIRLHPSIFEETFDALKEAISKYAGSSTASPLLIRDLREDLGSFQIVGPKAGRLLRRIFKVCRDESAQKKRLFANLKDPSLLPDGMVAGFRVYDTRLHFPPPAIPEDTLVGGQTVDGIDRSDLPSPSPDLATSSLWDANIREDILDPSYSKFDLDRRRHELSLPGTRLRPLAQDDRIPLLLVAQNNSYTILLPRGWSQAILHSITYTSTLLGGLEERRAMYREMGVLSFPEHYGEVCRAGKEWEETVAKEDERRWTRKPPGKRIENPTWRASWDKILGGSEEERMNEPGSGREHIWALPAVLKDYAGKAQGAANAFRIQRGMDRVEGLEKTGIVHVKLEVEGRGGPGRMAQIYALTREERTQWIEAVDRGSDRVHEDVPPALTLGELSPDQDRLVGYTSTGNFSLSRGHGYALGAVSLRAWNELSLLAKDAADGRGVLVKVRNNGGRLCRLARVELV